MHCTYYIRSSFFQHQIILHQFIGNVFYETQLDELIYCGFVAVLIVLETHGATASAALVDENESGSHIAPLVVYVNVSVVVFVVAGFFALAPAHVVSLIKLRGDVAKTFPAVDERAVAVVVPSAIIAINPVVVAAVSVVASHNCLIDVNYVAALFVAIFEALRTHSVLLPVAVKKTASSECTNSKSYRLFSSLLLL